MILKCWIISSFDTLTRFLVVEVVHLPARSATLVGCLVPRDAYFVLGKESMGNTRGGQGYYPGQEGEL